MRFLYRKATVVALAATSVLISGCGAAGTDGDKDGKGDEETYRIGVVIPSASSDYHARMKKGMDAADKKTPEVKLEYFYGSTVDPNAEDEIRGIKAAVVKQVDGIIIADAFPTTKPALEDALDAGIPVVVTDADLTGLSPKRAAAAATDNHAAGELAAKYIAEVAGDDAKVGLLDGLPELKLNYDRTDVAAQQLPDMGVDVVGRGSTGCTIEGGVTAAQNLLTAHPEITFLYSACGPPTVGAATVLKRMGLSDKVQLMGFDASNPEVDAIRKGTQLASVAQLPEQQGYFGVQMILEALETGKVPASKTTPTVIVTKENADSFLDGAIPKD